MGPTRDEANGHPAGSSEKALRTRIAAELTTPIAEALLDPLAAERLRWLAGQLDGRPQRDLVLLADLAGRRAMLTEPGTTAAQRLADDAVELSRESDSTAALVAALGVRHAVTTTNSSGRAGDARGIILAGQRLGRVDWVVEGYALLTDAALAVGDLDTATRSLDRMTTLATLLDSPAPSRSAAVRRVGLLAYQGDYDAARAQVDELAGTHPDVPESDLRLALALLFGRSLTTTERQLFEARTPSPRAELQAALLGDDEAAAYWLNHVDAAHQGPGALGNLALLARVAVARGDRRAAARLQPLLARYAGLLPLGPGFELPVDWHLARLALLLRDHDGALGHARRALEFARGVPSRLLEAWALRILSRAQRHSAEYAESAVSRELAATAAAPAGVLLPNDLTTGIDGSEATLRRHGSGWLIRSPLGGGVVPGLIGMSQLARLLDAAEPISAADLDGVLPVPRSRRALAAGVRASYRSRFAALWRSATGDALGVAEEVALLIEVRNAAGLAQQESPGAVLVPHRVGHSLRKAIEAIGEVAPDLGAHLRASVRTRSWCCYDPPPNAALTWRVDFTTNSAPTAATVSDNYNSGQPRRATTPGTSATQVRG